MNSSNLAYFIEKLTETPIIGIIRNEEESNVPYIVERSINAGLKTVEITLNTPNASSIIENTVREFSKDIIVGAGTVRNIKDLDVAISSGAQFIVTPNLDAPTIKKCVEIGLPIAPGVFTPTEVETALNLGATMLKVFPAKVLGPYFFKSIQDPFGALKLIATGGISLENIEDYQLSGAFGFGIGGRLFSKDLINASDWSGLEMHIRKFVDIVARKSIS